MGDAIPRVRVDGRALGVLMAKRGLSPAGLAVRAGVSAPLIRMLRGGQRRYSKLATAERISVALGEPVSLWTTPLVLPQASNGEAEETERNA